MRIFFFTLLFSTIISIPIRAQINDSLLWDSISALSTLRLFCEPGYISFTGGVGNIEPLIFEADIIPYYMLGINNKRNWGVGLSPRVILRMYNTESYPVRTPSFMPRVLFVHQLLDNNKRRDWFYYASWLHHSNGQEGSFFEADSSTINTRTGDFYTNWVEGGVFYSRLKGKLRYFFKAHAMYCYKYNKELFDRYGRSRFFLNYQSEHNIGKALKLLIPIIFDEKHSIINTDMKLGYIGSYIRNVGPFHYKRLIFSYMVSFKPPGLRDVTLFCQYYHGQDYYNLYFDRVLDVFRFGITAKASMFH